MWPHPNRGSAPNHEHPAYTLDDVLGYGILEWTFLVILVILVGLAGVFGLFMVLQLFRNPARR